MMRAAGARVGTTEAACPQRPSLAFSLTQPVAVQLQTFLTRFRRLLPCPRVESCRVGLPSYRHSRARLLFTVVVFSVFLMVAAYCAGQLPSRMTAAWLAGYWRWSAASGAGNGSDGSPCTLLCPNLFLPPEGGGESRGDAEGVAVISGGTSPRGPAGGPMPSSSWTPEVHRVEYACQFLPPSLPVPCRSNNTQSDLLTMEPILFIRNYFNPCWYETASPSSNSADDDAGVINDNLDDSGETSVEDAATARRNGRGLRGPRGVEGSGRFADGGIAAAGLRDGGSADAEYMDSLNPYRRNMFTCFSAAAVHSFQEMVDRQLVRKRTQHRLPRQRLRCLPHFYIAGMPKSGSTDLFKKVVMHPDVVRPPLKESHWWTKNRFGQRLNYTSSIPFRDYVDLFDIAASIIESHSASDVNQEDKLEAKASFHHKVTVDASASTFWNNDEWWRLPENCGRREPLFTNAHYIRRLTPQARVIVMFRNPTERLFSDYLYFTKVNKSLSAFHENVLLSLDTLNACEKQQSLRACVYNKDVANLAKVRVRVGIYHIYLSEWLKLFPREQLLVLRMEDYARDLSTSMRLVYKFLGLRPLTVAEEKRLMDMPKANARKKVDRRLGAMLNVTRHVLQDYYRPHNQVLAHLLQDHRFLWDDNQVATHEGGEAESFSTTTPGDDQKASREKDNNKKLGLVELGPSDLVSEPVTSDLVPGRSVSKSSFGQTFAALPSRETGGNGVVAAHRVNKIRTSLRKTKKDRIRVGVGVAAREVTMFDEELVADSPASGPSTSVISTNVNHHPGQESHGPQAGEEMFDDRDMLHQVLADVNADVGDDASAIDGVTVGHQDGDEGQTYENGAYIYEDSDYSEEYRDDTADDNKVSREPPLLLR